MAARRLEAVAAGGEMLATPPDSRRPRPLPRVHPVLLQTVVEDITKGLVIFVIVQTILLDFAHKRELIIMLWVL